MSGKLLAFTAITGDLTRETANETNVKYTATKLAVNDSQDRDTFWATSQLHASDLYSNTEGEHIAVLRALALLADAQDYFEAASAINPEDYYIEFDTEIMRGRIVLGSLFELRSINDGFAAVVNGISLALKNAETKILNKRQLTAIIGALQRVRRGPFLHFDSAMLVLDELEDVGLDVEPNAMNELLPVEYEESSDRDNDINGGVAENPESPGARDQPHPERGAISTPRLFDQRV